MKKSVLINLTKDEIEALTCHYLEKNCVSEIHTMNKIKGQSKMLNALKQLSILNLKK